jgi:conjugative transfer protein CagX
MKRALIVFLTLYAVSGFAGETKAVQPARGEVVQVATALDHLTVLEFGEPVTMAAAGSSAFQIERHDDKVFIKPLKAGVSTDLFVWTASRRFAYELEAPGEVSNMNFAIDSRPQSPKPSAETGTHIQDVADMMLTRALLGAERVDSSSISNEKGRVIVRTEHVFQSSNTLYIHYSVTNLSHQAYRLTDPRVTEAVAPQTTISLLSIPRTQLDQHLLRQVGELRERPVSPVRSEFSKEDVQPGEEVQGVIAIREQVATPTIFELTFSPEGGHKVKAVMVF